MTLRFAHRVGVSRLELAHTAGIALERLESGQPLTYDEGMRLWSAMEELTRDPFVGLTAGRKITLDQMGALGPAFAAAPSLREGLSRLIPLVRLVLDGASIELVTEGAHAGVAYRMPSVRAPHGVDSMFASMVALARQCTGHHICPRVIDLQAPWPTDLDVHAAYFGVRPTWARPICRLLFDALDLERPFEGADPGLSRVLLENAEGLLRADSVLPSPQVALEGAIAAAVEGGDASVRAVARRMGTSVRTLQRHIAKRGRTFAELRAEVVLHRARQLLRDGRPIDEVAARSGYATRAGFERAFARWTGQSPAAFRGSS